MQLNELDSLNKPYRIFAEYLDWTAIQQFVDAMRLDTAIKGALMPDAHAGYSLPIGGVVATEGVIYPSWVGNTSTIWNGRWRSPCTIAGR